MRRRCRRTRTPRPRRAASGRRGGRGTARAPRRGRLRPSRGRRPAADRPADARWSSDCAPSISRWSTRCWRATASSASPSWPRRRPARPSRSSSRGSGRRSLRRRARRRRRAAAALRRRPRCATGRPPVPRGRRRRGADRARATRSIGAVIARRRPTRRRRGARVPAPRRRGVADRGRGRGGQARRSSRTCAARSWRSCARGRTSTRREIVRRAARLGCDLSRGAVVLCAELTSDRPRHVVATIAGEYPGALAQHMDDGRACVRAAARGRRRRRARGDARGGPQARRRGCSATAPSGSRPSTPIRRSFGRAIQEAELVLDVLRRSDGGGGRSPRTSGRGTYRLLFRVLASHPEEVRSFYEDTVAPIVRYDDQYAHRPRRHARGLPRAELQHERDRGGDLRPPPHGRLPARPREGAHRASTRCSPRTASGSASA